MWKINTILYKLIGKHCDEAVAGYKNKSNCVWFRSVAFRTILLKNNIEDT